MQISALGKEELRHRMSTIAMYCLFEQPEFNKHVMKGCGSIVHVMTDEGQESRVQTVPAPTTRRAHSQARQIRRGSWPQRQR